MTGNFDREEGRFQKPDFKEKYIKQGQNFQRGHRVQTKNILRDGSLRLFSLYIVVDMVAYRPYWNCPTTHARKYH